MIGAQFVQIYHEFRIRVTFQFELQLAMSKMEMLRGLARLTLIFLSLSTASRVRGCEGI